MHARGPATVCKAEVVIPAHGAGKGYRRDSRVKCLAIGWAGAQQTFIKLELGKEGRGGRNGL